LDDDPDMSDTTTVSFNELLRDPSVKADPYPAYAQIRDMGRLVPTSFGDLVVTQHADAFTVLRDARFSSNSRHQPNHEQFVAMAEAVGLKELQDLFERVMLFADPPDHTRLRRIVGKAFTPRTVEAMRPRIAAIVDGLLDRVEADGGGDLVEALAFPLPVTVISDMLGVPAADHALLRSWTSAAVKALDPADDLSVFVPAAEAIRAMRAYFYDLVEERRANLGDDLLSGFILAEDAGDRLSHDELLDTTVLLFGAGHETTVNLISNGMLTMLRQPQLLRQLKDNPAIAPAFIEEMLRYEPPVHFTFRGALCDLEVGGETIPKGSAVQLMLASGSRDPRRFEKPDTFIAERPNNQHLGFGSGIHACFGAPLARLEGQIALREMARRLVNPRLLQDPPPYRFNPTLRGPRELAVAIDGVVA
jgi:cytochrome P450